MTVHIRHAEPTLAGVKAFLAERDKGLLIGGAWQAGSCGRIPTHDPATGAVLAHIARGGQGDVDRAVATDRGLRQSRRHLYRLLGGLRPA